MAGEPSSIIQQPGGDTLRRNFQQIQEGRTLSQTAAEQQPQANRNQKPQQQPQQQQQSRGDKQTSIIDEPGPPSRPALPRLIVVPDPPQHANRPLPPTPRSPAQSQSQAQAAAPQQPQRNSQSIFKPMVSLRIHMAFVFIVKKSYIYMWPEFRCDIFRIPKT